MMKFIELLQELQVQVPMCSRVEHDVDTRKAYMKKTRTFLHIIEESGVLKESEMKTLKRIRKKINDIWINYLYGRVNTTSSQMQNLLQYRIHDDIFMDYFQNTASQPALLYRGRISENPLMDVKAFYHIPFDQRYLIGNQRYSLSGIPCLYLASSMDCVYAELGQKDHVHLCTWQCKIHLPIFDMSIDYTYMQHHRYSRKEMVQFLYTMPLKYACSIEALDNDGAKFKTNYIIPQLITATLYNMNTDIKGICYGSIKGKDFPYDKRLNYVYLPVYVLGKDIYDMELITSFDIKIRKM